VEEITASGGRAVANTDDVSDWDGARGLVEQAVTEFGRLDVLVNNAGILRDAFIAGHGEEEWDAVIRVHLRGHFAVLRHAASYWKAESKAGRQPRGAVINTASASGVTVPNAAQAGYGAAKAAIAALTLVAAAELERYGIRVNAIAPVARTRLTLATPGMGAIFAAGAETDSGHDLFDPSNISPLVAYLAAEDCPLSGKVFAVQGGAIQELAGWSVVDAIETDGPWTIEDVAERLGGREPAVQV
jgi:NAD(P)-dependent dehydrogenase (short-subunit alcohol dehydrogenase family)